MGLNGVQVAPFGPKLGQNDAPDLRIIFRTLLGPKTLLKNQKNPENHQHPDFYRQVGGMRRQPGKSAAGSAR